MKVNEKLAVAFPLCCWSPGVCRVYLGHTRTAPVLLFFAISEEPLSLLHNLDPGSMTGEIAQSDRTQIILKPGG